MFRVISCLAISFLSTIAFSDSLCQNWFDNKKIKKTQDCVIECSVAKTDMATFRCPDLCPKLCQKSKTERFLFNLSDLYPGLTEEERNLSAKYPKKMLKAYKLSRKAEKLCLTLYKASKANDASDACRHFIWSALLYKEFGSKLSSEILNAHEKNINQASQEKAMDLANNRLGLIEAQNLKKINEESILKSFQKNLKSKNLIILKELPKNKKSGHKK